MPVPGNRHGLYAVGNTRRWIEGRIVGLCRMYHCYRHSSYGRYGWLAAVLHTSAVLFQTIKFSGVAYLLWMAWAVLDDHGGLSVRPVTSVTSMRLASRGILLNILNPKLPLFFMALIPQFVPAGSSPALLVGPGMVFTIMTFTVFMGYVTLASTGRQRVLQSATAMNWLRRAFSASFAALGLKLAIEKI